MPEDTRSDSTPGSIRRNGYRMVAWADLDPEQEVELPARRQQISDWLVSSLEWTEERTAGTAPSEALNVRIRFLEDLRGGWEAVRERADAAAGLVVNQRVAEALQSPPPRRRPPPVRESCPYGGRPRAVSTDPTERTTRKSGKI